MNKSNLRRTYKIFKLYEKYISENTNPISLIQFIKVTDSIIPIENIRTMDTIRGMDITMIIMDELND